VSFEILEDDRETSTIIWIFRSGGDLRIVEIDESKLIKGEDLKAKMKTLFLKK
jgi:hypothetical protein